MIRVDRVSKRYRQGAIDVAALRDVSLEITKGQFVSIMGPSGSGKSTLLNLMGALDRPTDGEVWIDGNAIQSMKDEARTRLRRERIGFVFQFFNLLPTLSAIENACLPALLAGRPRAEVWPRAESLLAEMGIGHRSAHRPTQLSGGEMQRVAVARALIMNPPVVLADEPTGNLDSKSGLEILGLLQRASREKNHTIVMVTHDAKAATFGDAIIELKDGEIVARRAVNRIATASA
jgi:putative ABC transport system ATP-binding protein